MAKRRRGKIHCFSQRKKHTTNTLKKKTKPEPKGSKKRSLSSLSEKEKEHNLNMVHAETIRKLNQNSNEMNQPLTNPDSSQPQLKSKPSAQPLAKNLKRRRRNSSIIVRSRSPVSSLSSLFVSVSRHPPVPIPVDITVPVPVPVPITVDTNVPVPVPITVDTNVPVPAPISVDTTLPVPVPAIPSPSLTPISEIIGTSTPQQTGNQSQAQTLENRRQAYQNHRLIKVFRILKKIRDIRLDVSSRSSIDYLRMRPLEQLFNQFMKELRELVFPVSARRLIILEMQKVSRCMKVEREYDITADSD